MFVLDNTPSFSAEYLFKITPKSEDVNTDIPIIHLLMNEITDSSTASGFFVTYI